jgi:hypothetical protein
MEKEEPEIQGDEEKKRSVQYTPSGKGSEERPCDTPKGRNPNPNNSFFSQTTGQAVSQQILSEAVCICSTL